MPLSHDKISTFIRIHSCALFMCFFGGVLSLTCGADPLYFVAVAIVSCLYALWLWLRVKEYNFAYYTLAKYTNGWAVERQRAMLSLLLLYSGTRSRRYVLYLAFADSWGTNSPLMLADVRSLYGVHKFRTLTGVGWLLAQFTRAHL